MNSQYLRKLLTILKGVTNFCKITIISHWPKKILHIYLKRKILCISLQEHGVICLIFSTGEFFSFANMSGKAPDHMKNDFFLVMLYGSSFNKCVYILFSKEERSIGLSVQFSHSVVSDSLQPHALQHARPSYPSPTPGVHSNSRASSR